MSVPFQHHAIYPFAFRLDGKEHADRPTAGDGSLRPSVLPPPVYVRLLADRRHPLSRAIKRVIKRGTQGALIA